MKEKEALFFREARRRITEICDAICKEKWKKAFDLWEALDFKMEEILSKDEACHEILLLCRECVKKQNDMRLWDLLAYELDPYFARRLCALSRQEREILARNARRENEEAAARRKELCHMLLKKDGAPQMEPAYAGTENVGIAVREGSHSFQLFSDIHPWQEASDFINESLKTKKACNEICVLGFGGGHAVRLLTERFPGARIRVYLPRPDVFRTVFSHIPIVASLNDEHVEFVADSLCLEFLSAVTRGHGKEGFGYYIDRRELRACMGSLSAAESFMKSLERGLWRSEDREEAAGAAVGEAIERYIRGLVVDGAKKNSDGIWNKAGSN